MIKFEEIRKHFGTFGLDARSVAAYPDLWGKILSSVLVTRCEHIFYKDIFLYSGFSMLFRIDEEGQSPPYYTFGIDEFNDLIVTETKELEITRR